LSDLLLGLGFVAIIEGLVLALAPSRLEQVLELLREIGADKMRVIGLITITVGVALIWLARG